MNCNIGIDQDTKMITSPSMSMPISGKGISKTAKFDAAFAALAGERPDALFVAPDAFLVNRGVQLAALAKRDRIPAFFGVREPVEAGGLMSYGIDLAEMFRQVGAYTGRILRGDKPADLPVLQAIKLELVINLQTARALGIEIPPGILSIADDVID